MSILFVETLEIYIKLLVIEVFVLSFLIIGVVCIYHRNYRIKLLKLLNGFIVIINAHSRLRTKGYHHDSLLSAFSYPRYPWDAILRGMQRYTVISMGEPAGTSPEMIIKTVRSLSTDSSVWLIVTGDGGVFRKTASDLSLSLPFTYYADSLESLREAESKGENMIFFSSSSIDLASFRYGQISAETGKASYEALRAAVEIIQNGHGHSLVTSPVSGEALKAAGYKERSVFDLLSTFASTARLCNMLRGGYLNIFGLTHRISIKDAIGQVKRENIISALVDIDSITMSPYFDRSKPIAVASLNPTRPDGTWTGPDEEEAIVPAVEVVKKLGINVVGPLSAEEIFAKGAEGEYSSILVMTAGVGFAAVSAASPGKASVITWGLPFLRVGPLLDTDLKNAGKGVADSERMEASIAMALLLREASLMA